MQFKLVKTGRTYAECQSEAAEDRVPSDLEQAASCQVSEVTPPIHEKVSGLHPVIWKGTVAEYRSLLVVREAELVLAKSQLTGKDRADWYAKNRILDLERKITDLRKWLAEAREKDES